MPDVHGFRRRIGLVFRAGFVVSVGVRALAGDTRARRSKMSRQTATASV